MIAFVNSYARLPDHFFAFTEPAKVPKPTLLRLNESLAENLGIDLEWLRSPDGVAMLAGNAMPEGAEPLAQAYGGHQFGGWSPQLGDGRAILLGEVIDLDGKRRDLQLKGSGRTPFSRGGDGKAALGPVLREYILSEAMQALGVPTTRALAAVSTGEQVRRETPLPGAILTRVASSHLRVGTFQYFYAQNDVDALRTLADHAMARHYPHANSHEEFFEGVIANQAKLIAHWMALGFIHGVMNTDNMTISGETIDYGPCAFMDTFHPAKVFSSIDVQGRYAWGNQAGAGQWNLMRLAEALSPLLGGNPEEAMAQVESSFAPVFTEHYLQRFRDKLGLCSPQESDESFIKRTLSLLAESEVDYTLFFRHLTKAAAEQDEPALVGLFPDPDMATTWLALWRDRTASHLQESLKQMRAANPILIPRNHQVENAIQHGNEGDFAPFHRLVDALAQPYEEQPQHADLEQAPLPNEVVCKTFCGT